MECLLCLHRVPIECSLASRTALLDSRSTQILFKVDYVFTAYKDGHVERAAGTMATVPAGFDPDTGVTSKDVVIDAATGLAARLFLPVPAIQTAAPTSKSDDSSKLPILVFYHGGYFIVGSPGSPSSHRYVNSLAANARVIAVSVRYRLAPGHLLPSAYDDAWAALNWAASGADTWLSEHGDLDRVFLAGVSAGANIAHNMAVAAGMRGLHVSTAPVRVEGVVLLHPSFAAEHKMEAEDGEFCQSNRIRWEFIFPDAENGLDDPRINPMAAGAPSLANLAGERLLVCTASEDPRAPRGRAYRDAVRASGWRGEVEWYESNGEGHAFFMNHQDSRDAIKLMDRVVHFLAGH